MRNTRTRFLSVSVIAGALLLGGCNKKVAKVTPPLPPAQAQPAPTATIAASPAVIQSGQSAILSWHTQNANNVTIDGLGTVNPSGTQTVSPGSSTTYTLVAKGPGGTKDASARLTVNAVVSQAPTLGPNGADLFAKNVKDLFFNFNQADIRPDEAPIASGDAAFLQQHRAIKVVVEGHCDDRGSEEYNIALGQSRAQNFKEQLLKDGVSADRVKTISYGKEKPFCVTDDEACWQENRRDHLVPEQ